MRAKLLQARRTAACANLLRRPQTPSQSPAGAAGYGKARRSSLTGNQAADFLQANAEAAEMVMPTKGLVLDELNDTQLKLMANSLSEIGRRRNFIRLYPTKSTAQRYAPLVDPWQSPQREMTPSGFTYGRKGGSQKSATALLTSLLFGPPPTRSSHRPRRDLFRRQGASAMTHSASSPHSSFSLRTERTEETGDAEMGGATSSTAEACRSLSSRPMQRLLFMEYLVRVSRACDALSLNDKAKIAQSPSCAHLSGFHRQLKQKCVADFQEDEAGLEHEGGGLVDELEDLCHENLEMLAKEIWGEATMEAPKQFNKYRDNFKLEDFLHADVVSSAEGQKVLQRIARFTAGDLEHALAASNYMDFRLHLESPPDRSSEAFGQPTLPGFAEGSGHRIVSKRPLSSGYHGRRSAQDRRQETTGVLNDLLRANLDPATTCSNPGHHPGRPRSVLPQPASQQRTGHEAVLSQAQTADSGSPRTPVPHVAATNGSSIRGRRPRSGMRPPSASKNLQPLEPPTQAERLSHARSTPSLVNSKMEALLPLRFRSSQSLKMNTQLAADTRLAAVADKHQQVAIMQIAPDFLADIEL
jgi:hypothetical protein